MKAAASRAARCVLLAAALAMAGLVFAGAASASSPSASPGQVTLNVGWDQEPDNLNPFVGYQQSSYELYHLQYDFLTDYGAAHLETKPGLATSWSHTPDGLTWTFKIRSGVKWSDGVPLTAHDIAFTYNSIITYGLAEYLAAMSAIKTVTAPDDTTLVITCSRPKADILAMWVPIVPEHIWSKFHSYKEFTNFVNSPPIVSSGPFQVVEWKHGQYVRAVANKSYWGGTPKVDEIIFSLYTNQMTMASDLSNNTIQLAIDLPPAELKQMGSNKSIVATACDQKAFDYLSFNCYAGPSKGNPVLRDWKFRNALNWAVDKQKLVELAYISYATPGSTLFEPNFYDPTLDWHWTPPASEAYTFDLKKAGDLLTAAGYPLKNGVRLNKQGKPIVLRLWARTDSPQSQTMGKLITGWFTQLGLTIQYSVHDSATLSDGQLTYTGKTYTPDYDMYIWLWQPSGSDPTRRLGYFTTDNIQTSNDCCWSNKQYDALVQQQASTLDQQQRKQLVWQAEKIFYTQTPYIILDYPKLLEGWNIGSWEGWKRIPTPNGAVAFITDNIDNYITVGPTPGVVASTHSSTGTIVGIVVGAVVVVALALWFFIRRRRGPAEEA